MNNKIIDSLKMSLDRTVPINDPKYIIGEEDSLSIFNGWIESVNNGASGFIGGVVLGQVGNGKTHFLRHVRQKYNNEVQNIYGIYIPDMFVGGPLVNALNHIYNSLFSGPGNDSLRFFIKDWENYISQNDYTEYLQNNIIRYLSRCNNTEEVELVLDYFSNKELFPDQLKFLKNKFGAKKSFISNENEFAVAICDALEFIQMLTQKNIALFFDEVDKVYSAETNSVTLTRVGSKILSAYRVLFDNLNIRNIKGLICIGATPEAWDVLSTQTAFERRFKDRKIILKVPKSKKDCYDFIIKRLEEVNYSIQENDTKTIEALINQMQKEKTKTWADVISGLKHNNETSNTIVISSPADLILDILNSAIAPLTWAEIVSKSTKLQEMYPKSQPTPVLNKLKTDKKIKVNSTRPKTYESILVKD